MFVPQFSVQLTMLPTAQPLVVSVVMYFIELLVIVVVTILETVVSLVVLTIPKTVAALRGCRSWHHRSKCRYPN